MNPNKKSPYGDLNLSSTNPHLKCALYLFDDATWHIYRSEMDSMAPSDSNKNVMSYWKNWEAFDGGMALSLAQKQHELLFGFKPHKNTSKIELTLIIYAYRCAQAIDHRTEATMREGARVAGNPLERKSSIAGRRYRILPVPDNLLIADGTGIVDGITEKKVTGKQGLVCYRIIEQTAATDKVVSEGRLKTEVERRAAEITTKVDSAWRFMQFYRPILVSAGLIEYIK